MPAIGSLGAEDRHGTSRDLQEEIEFLRRRCWIRDDDIRAIHCPGEELIDDILVELFVILLAIAIAMAVEVLRDKQFGLLRCGSRRLDLLVDGEKRTCGGEGEGATVGLCGMFWRIERQIEDGEGEHYFGEIAMSLGKVR